MDIKRIILFSALLLTLGCSKEEEGANGGPSDRDVIRFSVGTKAVSTKLGATTETIGDGTYSIIARGTEASASITYNNSENLALELDKNGSGFWFPNGNSNWKNWKSAGYSFTTYAYSPKTATSGRPSALTVTSPTQISITQPQTYTYGDAGEKNFIDYLLSYRHDITNGLTKPVVTMKLEHALSDVEVYVIKDPSIQGVRVSQMSVGGFYRQASMTCTQAQYVPNGTQPVNFWTASLQGSSNNTYTWTDTANPKSATDEIETTPARMKMIMVPQATDNLVLNVNLEVNEQDDNGVDHWVNHPYNNISFSGKGLATNWLSGHKYIYILTVDTGIHLKGYIIDWIEGGSIETTILPDIPDND